MKAAKGKYFIRIFFIFQVLIFLLNANIFCQKKYTLRYILAGKDTSYNLEKL